MTQPGAPARASKQVSVESQLATHAEMTAAPRRHHPEPAGGAGQLQGPGPVGRAHGRGRAAAGRLRRARELREADGRRRAAAPSPTSRSSVAQGPGALHGREVPAGRLPPLPRGRHRRRTRRPTEAPSCATSACGCASWPRASTPTGDRRSVDYVLLFLPNETVSGFIHEHDPTLVDEALGQKVVLCSPLTLFALLGVIRQAFDNFIVEQTSDEILAHARRVRAAVGEVRRRARHGRQAARVGRSEAYEDLERHPRRRRWRSRWAASKTFAASAAWLADELARPADVGRRGRAARAGLSEVRPEPGGSTRTGAAAARMVADAAAPPRMPGSPAP